MALRSHFEMVQLNLRVPRGIHGFWAVIRELDAADSWTVAQIVARTNVHTRSVSQYVDALANGGFAKIVGYIPATRRGRRDAALYRLARKPADAPRLRRDGTELPETEAETLWRTMKMMKTFTPRELVGIASEAREISLSYARGYLSLLHGAGVIAITRRRTATAEAHYRLARNLGSRAPKILETRIVFDPNSCTVIAPADGREVRP